MNICIIPARGGSKRIHHKNIKDFCGKPIIAYSIQNARESKIFDAIIVSTDDSHIATIAKQYGAKVPFMRPQELSGDMVGTLPVIAHCIKEIQAQDNDIVCCLYPTAPLIDSSHITQAYNTLKSNPKKNYVFFATEFEKNPYRGFVLIDSAPKLLFSEFEQTRTQDLPPVYSDAGVLYMGKAVAFREQRRIFSTDSIALPLESARAQDIDTLDDWHKAQEKYKRLYD